MQKALVSYVSWWHFYYFTYAGDTLCAGDTLEPPVPITCTVSSAVMIFDPPDMYTAGMGCKRAAAI